MSRNSLLARVCTCSCTIMNGFPPDLAGTACPAQSFSHCAKADARLGR
jgi:hypothetical protein